MNCSKWSYLTFFHIKHYLSIQIIPIPLHLAIQAIQNNLQNKCIIQVFATTNIILHYLWLHSAQWSQRYFEVEFDFFIDFPQKNLLCLLCLWSKTYLTKSQMQIVEIQMRNHKIFGPIVLWYMGGALLSTHCLYLVLNTQETSHFY